MSRLRPFLACGAVATFAVASGASFFACSEQHSAESQGPAALGPAVPGSGAGPSDDDDDENERIGEGRTQPSDDTHGVIAAPSAGILHGEIAGMPREARAATLPRMESVTASPIFNFTTGTGAARIDIGGSPADSTVAASSTHVCLTARDAFACYTKAGTLVGLGNGLGANPITAKNFFAASNITLGPLPTCTPPPDASTCNAGTYTKDARILFDQYTRRFFLVFQTREPTPPGGRLAIAVSKSEDPRDGWYTWLDGVHQAHDYGYLGVTSQYLVATELGTSGAGTIHFLFPTAELVSGQTSYSSLLVQTSGMDSSVPCVNVTTSPDVYWVHRDDGTHVSVYDWHAGGLYHVKSADTIRGTTMTCDSNGNLVDSVSTLTPLQESNDGGTAPLRLCANQNNPKMCEFRDGKITWVSEDKIQAPDSTYHIGIHLVQMDATNVLGGSVPVVRDRIFGISSANDPAGSIFDYAMPAVATNSLGDVVVGEIRTNGSTYPDLRGSVWPNGASDIESSISIGPGVAPLLPVAQYHMGGAAVDPSSTGVYLSQQVPNGSPPWVIKVNKMLGSTLPDLYPQLVQASASTVTHGVPFTVDVQVVNQGDATAPATTATLYYGWAPGTNLVQAPFRAALANIAIPTLPPGINYATTVTVTIANASQGALALQVDSTDAVTETSETNNVNPLLADPYGNFPITVQ